MKRAFLVLALAGCAEATFSAHSRDNNVEDIKRAMAVSQPSPPTEVPMAFLSTTDRELVAWNLRAGAIAWREKADLRSRLAHHRRWIAHRSGASAIVARESSSGKVMFSFDLKPEEKFVGIALDDERLYYVVQTTPANGQRTSYLVAVDQTGHELWRTPAPGSLGAPAARGGLVAVPHAYQNVTFIDGKTGQELARIRATDEQITYVRAQPDGFYYGGAKGVCRFDEKSAAGTQAGSDFIAANLGSEQVRLFYWWDAYQLAQADYSAFDRNRLLWRAEDRGGHAAFSDDEVVLHSYRYFFAFDAKLGKLRWAYAHPRVDMISAKIAGPTVVFASADGELGVLDAKTGAVKARQKTGLHLLGASFDAEGFVASGSPSDVEQPDVVKTLSQIIFDPDARFTAVKVFAADSLGDVPGKEASAALLKIVLASGQAIGGVPPAAQKKAGERLVARADKDALPLYLDALKGRYDFLEDKQPRAVDVLARAVAALDAKEAAPDLAAHLLDPATPAPALKDIAAALGSLGGKDAARALKEFLLTYRADPGFLTDPAPLTAAAEALLKIGGPDARRTAIYVAEEKRTVQPLSAWLKKALEPAKPEAAPVKKARALIVLKWAARACRPSTKSWCVGDPSAGTSVTRQTSMPRSPRSCARSSPAETRPFSSTTAVSVVASGAPMSSSARCGRTKTCA